MNITINIYYYILLLKYKVNEDYQEASTRTHIISRGIYKNQNPGEILGLTNPNCFSLLRGQFLQIFA